MLNHIKTYSVHINSSEGGEKEVILLTPSRTESLGFIEDARRFNVALTRAKRHLLIVGSASALRANDQWRHVLDHARSLGGYVSSLPFLEAQSFDFHTAPQRPQLQPQNQAQHYPQAKQ